MVTAPASQRAGNQSKFSPRMRATPKPKAASDRDWMDTLASWSNTLRRYEPSCLKHDLVAGLVMTAMLVPVGIAYAQASGLPGITGLYATIVPLLAYAVFGPSPILILGPDSALAAVILSVVVPLSAGDSQRAVRIAGLMAIVSGTLCVTPHLPPSSSHQPSACLSNEASKRGGVHSVGHA